MIKKEKIIEILTYIIVPLAMLVISPIIAKLIDKKIFNLNYLISQNIFLLIISIIVIFTGILLVFYTIFLFKRYGNGTPNPKLPPKKIIIKGPYKYSRNPMALGGTIILLGESIFYYSISLFIITILYTIILYFNAKFIEEPELLKRFGNSYKEYLKKVPRFFPFFIKK
jgi:protein-S-isoprenylcysteine O-methyltransferase Ste14